MPKLLSAAHVKRYDTDGFCFPVPVLDAQEVRELRADLEDWERHEGHLIDWPEKSKSYLLFDWADRLVHHPRVLDAVEDIIGPDILVYHSTLFVKQARQPAYVRWHQDSTYFYLEPHLHITAWVALSDASVEAGCMRAIAGSHRGPLYEHDDRPEPMNLIKRGQGISGQFNDSDGVLMPVAAGELSLHHTDLVHASGANNSDDRRIGFAISYIPASVRPIGAPQPSALLVRGQDRQKHFLPEKRLQTAWSAQARAEHAEALARFRARQDAGFSVTATA